jgi:hypothetical protein
MAFTITLAGSSEAVAGTEGLTEETLQTWLDENQVYYTTESADRPESGDLTKYIVLRND